MTPPDFYAARQARDQGMAAAQSRPAAGQDALVIDQAIRHFADSGAEFSVNDVRRLLPVVAPQLVGSRFLAASNRRQIERVGSTLADHEKGHARRVSVWRKASGTPVVPRPRSGVQPTAPRQPAAPQTPALSPDGEAVLRKAQWALAGGSGKGGIKTVAEARSLIRELIDVLGQQVGTGTGSDMLLLAGHAVTNAVTNAVTPADSAPRRYCAPAEIAGQECPLDLDRVSTHLPYCLYEQGRAGPHRVPAHRGRRAVREPHARLLPHRHRAPVLAQTGAGACDATAGAGRNSKPGRQSVP